MPFHYINPKNQNQCWRNDQFENEIEYGGRRIRMHITFAQYKHCSVLHHKTIKPQLKKNLRVAFVSPQHS
jgi:hypothetical protein